MSLVRRSHLTRRGFTLIEVIITIVIAAVLGSFVLSYLGTSLTQSGYAVSVVRNEGLAEACMERIISDYVKAMNSAGYAAALATIKGQDYQALCAMPASSPPPTMIYVDYNAGVEIPGTTNRNLEVTVQVGDARLISLLTAERSSGSDPYVTY